jgi:DNA mismatch repair protein MutL
MSAKIHILPNDLANKIAAGEVVGRPASVVKELVENSLDAGATRIVVAVKDAGKTLIQVTDNGAGMNAEDAVLSLARHATSKINSVEDLENIRTFGFRGEALASIAAVAQVELRTRDESEDVAISIRVEASEIKEQSKEGMERGTSVTVKNLFYNTPARRNFLKSRQTELRNITDVVTRMAIGYPEVEWLYVNEEETLFHLKAKTKEDRLREILGEKQYGSLVPLNEKTEYVTLDGFIGRPDFARKGRIEQYVYLNRRYIQSRMVNHAVFHGYEHILEKGSFPFFIINISLDPRKIDVNVHPSKMEVKFENESNVYRMILSVVRKTLAANNLIPTVSFRSEEAGIEDNRLRFDRPQSGFGSGAALNDSPSTLPVGGMNWREQSERTEQSAFERMFDRPSTGLAQRDNVAVQAKVDQIIAHSSTSGQGTAIGNQENRAIWQIHNKYIFSQVKSGLMIVDQHAAHERILYERVLSNFKNSIPTSQQLLFPQTIELAPNDYLLLNDLLPYMERLGFDLRLFGKNTVIVEGIPADVRVGDERQILEDVLNEYRMNEHSTTIDARETLAKSFACKAAIKTGDRLSPTEMIALVDNLFLTEMPYVCPHGRPIVVKISTEELDRRFGRTG